jgi:hypothetical protein
VPATVTLSGRRRPLGAAAAHDAHWRVRDFYKASIRALCARSGPAPGGA